MDIMCIAYKIDNVYTVEHIIVDNVCTRMCALGLVFLPEDRS